MNEDLELFEEKKKKPEKKSKKITAIKISGIKSEHLLFRHDGSDRSLRFKLVPVDDWQGKEEQQFDEKKFRSYKTPAFFKN